MAVTKGLVKVKASRPHSTVGTLCQGPGKWTRSIIIGPIDIIILARFNRNFQKGCKSIIIIIAAYPVATFSILTAGSNKNSGIPVSSVT